MDLVIKGGHVIDPAQSIDAVRNIAVANGVMAEYQEKGSAVREINAEGCLVLPGLIDYCTHIYYPMADARDTDWMLASGVTATVDCATCGPANYVEYNNKVAAAAKIKTKTILNIAPAGLIDFYKYRADPDYSFQDFDIEACQRLIEQYRNDIVGLGVLVSKRTMQNIVPLQKTLAFADKVSGLPVVAIIVDPPCSSEEILSLLRPGDVYAHCYQDMGTSLLDESEKVKSQVLEAKARGVLFDSATGKANLSFACAKGAIEQGVLPNMITTDYVNRFDNGNEYNRDLPTVMSKFYAMGMDLRDIVRGVTQAPAAAMGMAGWLGTLANGACADITILEKKSCKAVFHNASGTERMEGDTIFVPKMTILNGKVAYCAAGFDLQE